jgi:hypothetical protein
LSPHDVERAGDRAAASGSSSIVLISPGSHLEPIRVQSATSVDIQTEEIPW